MPDATAAALRKASQGLHYPSETDAPFQTFRWGKAEGRLTKKKVLQLGKHDPDSPVEEVNLEDFFQDLTREQDWHGEEEKEDVQRYRALLEALREHLSGAKVFKVGQAQKRVYIVGKTKEGDWAGLKTTAVET
jgi:hypothetical protein